MLESVRKTNMEVKINTLILLPHSCASVALCFIAHRIHIRAAKHWIATGVAGRQDEHGCMFWNSTVVVHSLVPLSTPVVVAEDHDIVMGNKLYSCMIKAIMYVVLI